MSNNRLGATFIKTMRDRAFESSAVRHPYLDAIRHGDFPNIELALKDFAFQYGIYNSQFIRCLSAVIDNLSQTEHKHILQSNLDEERGHVHEIELPPAVLASIDGVPHPHLFRRFQESLGVDAGYCVKVSGHSSGLLWSQKFLNLCEMNEYVGVGAIGIGTELIVSNIYNQILLGLKAHSDLTVMQHVFFDLHSECDDEHGAQMLQIAEELALDQKACEKIEYGVTAAIKLRTEFWDNMLERALTFPSSSNSQKEFSTFGY